MLEPLPKKMWKGLSMEYLLKIQSIQKRPFSKVSIHKVGIMHTQGVFITGSDTIEWGVN